MIPTSSIKITYPSESVPQDSGIGPLPIDVVVHTLSFLNFNELQECVVLSKTMKSITIESANYNKVEEIKFFIQKLKTLLDRRIQQINAYHHQKDSADNQIGILNTAQSLLKYILSSLEFPKFSNLSLLKAYVEQVKDQIIDALISLDQTTLEVVSEIHASDLLNNVFKISQIYSRTSIAISNAEANDIVRIKALSLPKAVEDLLAEGQTQRALVMAKSIEHPAAKAEAIKAIAVHVCQNGKVERALELASSIEHCWNRSMTFKSISDYLSSKDETEAALKLAYSIEDPLAKICALSEISENLIKVGCIKRAFEVTLSMTADCFNVQSEALAKVAMAFFRRKDEMSSFIQAVQSIPSSHIRGELFQNIKRLQMKARSKAEHNHHYTQRD